jgi:DNA sulfur modification protein DndC
MASGERVLLSNGFDVAYQLNKRWVLAFSGGKDSTVLLDLTFRYWLEHGDVDLTVVHNEVLLDPPVLYEWVYRVLPAVASYGIETIVIVPRLDYITLMLGRGYSAPGPGFMWCTTEMKRKPVERFMASMNHGTWVKLTGVRLDESANRRRLIISRCGLGTDVCGSAYWLLGKKWASIDVAPIVNWSTEDVVTYLKTHKQPWTGETEDYSFLLNRVYCGRETMRNGCWICTVVSNDEMLRTYAECLNDPRYLRILELKRQLKAISLDWNMRLHKSKKFNDEGKRRARELLIEMFKTMPELLRPWVTFKPHVIEEYLPELIPLMKSIEPLNIKGVKIVET